ncbi:sensor histidine kinase [Neobacillus ginsengisoli]|uniref:histidine kinase n=1 Tax=Neobacillus ginsengisoli TaxID=904295 RepID=A0ABT9XZ45_9BACI|nr:HAMP domain-containing sensor histidine kinase [Neobacillus ginsengisoli]MDQ0200754.1 signal transduction histidine kinase [Neobacillus ginsengisoli]
MFEGKEVELVNENNLYLMHIWKPLDYPEFRGEIHTYTNIEYAFLLGLKTIVYTTGSALLMIYISSFLTAFYAMRDIYVPLNTALKRLVHVNKNNFNERIPYIPNRNPYLNLLADEVNVILERSEQAVLSQQQSAREITHQIRTPLTSIRQSIDYFRMFGFKNEKKVQERLDIMEKEVERIASMTNKIISLSRLEEIPTEDAEHYDLSRNMIDYMDRKRADNENVIFEQNIQEGITTFIPYDHILEIVDSLIENAVKYSFEPKHIYTKLTADETTIQITVRNRGVEIPEDEIDKIFEHSYRAKAVQKDYVGTGLGLAVVKRFVELHKGRTHVTSENNVTTFVVTLPNKIKGKK